MNPPASIPETAFPEPYLLTETEHTIIVDGILELLNTHGLTSHQSMNIYPPGDIDQDHGLPNSGRIAIGIADQTVHSITDQPASI